MQKMSLILSSNSTVTELAFGQFAKRLADIALRDESAKTQILQMGGVSLLVHLVKTGTDEALLLNASFALGVMCSGVERVAVADAGGVEVLVLLLKEDSRSDAVLANAAIAIQNLAKEEVYRIQIEELGGLTRLVQICTNSSDDELLASAAGALCNLSDNENNRIKIAALGGLEALVSLCNLSRNDAVLENAAAALGNLADTDINRMRITEIGGLEPLVRLCASSIQDGVLEAAAAAMANLAYNESTRKRIAKIGGIEPLIWLCGNSKNNAVLESATAALGNLAYYNDNNKAKITDLGGMDILVKLCSTSECESVLENAANALRHIVYNHASNRNRLSASGGLISLAALCMRPSSSTTLLESVLAVLRKGINNAPVAYDVVRTGAVQAIMDLSLVEGTVGSHAQAVVRSLLRHSNVVEWLPPTQRINAPTVVYLSLASGDSSIAQDVVNRPVIESTSDIDGEEPSYEEIISAAKSDVSNLGNFLQNCDGADVVGIADLNTNEADPLQTLQSFFLSDADLFVLSYSGCSAGDSGAWCFSTCLVGLWDILQLWNTARSEAVNKDARLIIISDSPFSGKWVDALMKTNAAMIGDYVINVGIQASCGPDELSYQMKGQGGIFTQFFTSTNIHNETAANSDSSCALHPEQTPCMYAKWDQLSSCRKSLNIGSAEQKPAISLL